MVVKYMQKVYHDNLETGASKYKIYKKFEQNILHLRKHTAEGNIHSFEVEAEIFQFIY